MSILVDLGDPFICKIETNTIPYGQDGGYLILMGIFVDLGDPFICKIETNTITIRTRRWISDTHEHTRRSW